MFSFRIFEISLKDLIAKITKSGLKILQCRAVRTRDAVRTCGATRPGLSGLSPYTHLGLVQSDDPGKDTPLLRCSTSRCVIVSEPARNICRAHQQRFEFVLGTDWILDQVVACGVVAARLMARGWMGGKP